MAQKKSYSRYFIILQEDEKGYALASDKLPSGYAKLETKSDRCKISFYVQNLKKDDSAYHMVLICSKKDVKKIIKLGELNIDDHGRAEVSKEYAVENIAETRIPADKIVGAAVVKVIGNNILSVMCGFSSTDIEEWKNFEMVEGRHENIEMAPIESPETNMEKNIFDQYEDNIKPENINGKVFIQDSIDNMKPGIENTNPENMKQENMKPENVKPENVKPENEKPENVKPENVKPENEKPENVKPENVKPENEKPENVKPENVKPENEKPENVKPENIKIGEVKKPVNPNMENDNTMNIKTKKVKKANTNINNMNNAGRDDFEEEYGVFPVHSDLMDGVQDFLMRYSRTLKEEKDISMEIKNCRWFRVPAEMLYDYCNVINYPILNCYPLIARYGQIMLGYKYDKYGDIKYLVYGIPGRRNWQDQPFGGETGFVTWMNPYSGNRADSDFGYWLMFYDYKTETILIPSKH